MNLSLYLGVMFVLHTVNGSVQHLLPFMLDATEAMLIMFPDFFANIYNNKINNAIEYMIKITFPFLYNKQLTNVLRSKLKLPFDTVWLVCS